MEARVAEAEALAVKHAEAAHAAERRAAASQDAADRARDALADARAEAERNASAMEDLRRGAARQEARTQEVLVAQRAALADLDAARRELAALRVAEAKVQRAFCARAVAPPVPPCAAQRSRLRPAQRRMLAGRMEPEGQTQKEECVQRRLPVTGERTSAAAVGRETRD